MSASRTAGQVCSLHLHCSIETRTPTSSIHPRGGVFSGFARLSLVVWCGVIQVVSKKTSSIKNTDTQESVTSHKNLGTIGPSTPLPGRCALPYLLTSGPGPILAPRTPSALSRGRRQKYYIPRMYPYSVCTAKF